MEHYLDLTSFDNHLHGSGQPVDGVFNPKPPDYVAISLDLGRPFLSETLLDVNSTQNVSTNAG